MQQQLQVMLDLQDSMNTRVNADWRQQNFEWYRAIWIESAEMLDHYGWKWWKKQTPDMEQVTLELVDIWHFGLSILLLEQRSAAAIADVLDTHRERPSDLQSFPLELEQFVTRTLETRSFPLDNFARLLHATDLDFTSLYARYVGKNVLNFFRQDHGYQDGSYQKLWGGREDNEHLVELSERLDPADPAFKDRLYEALDERYRALME